MTDRLTKIFSDSGDAAEFSILQVAVGALMIKAAAADDDFQAAERETIETQLTRRFSLAPGTAGRLIEAALAFLKDSKGMYACSMVLNDELEDTERMALLEMIWEIMYADGVLHQYEERLMRRVGPILDIDEADSLRIRDEVRARMEISPE
ncbi:TerB family tellurite resistance protein [Magnetospira thiophila]